MKIKEFNKQVYDVLNTYIENELKASEIVFTKEYVNNYGMLYQLQDVGKLGKIDIVLESDNECRRSSKSEEVDILSFTCHFDSYHNEDNLFDNRFNIRSGKYNLRTMSADYDNFIESAKRVINTITMNSKELK